MNTKILIAALLGGICSTALGWVLYGMLLKNMMAGMMGSATGVMRADSEMVIWAMVLGNLTIGYLVSDIFSTWAGISTFMGGLTAGAVLGLLFSAGMDFLSYGTSNMMQLNGVFLDIVASIIIWSISSGVVGWWLGRSK